MIVTKADVYEKVIFAKRPVCPHCGKEMKIWECTETGFSCGSGWGTPYLFVCFNDHCPAFVKGWENMKKNYGRTCSCRCISFPDSGTTEMMMVFSSAGGKSEIIDEAVIAVDKARGTPDDPAVQQLIQHFESGDVETLLANLFDRKAHYGVRIKGAELLGELGLLEIIEPVRNYKFHDTRVGTAARNAIKHIHEINGTRECPYCAEIVKAGEALCSQCERELS